MKLRSLLSISLFISLNSLAQAPDYVSTSSLVAWYPFNGTAMDMSGNGNHCATFNGPAPAADRFNNAAASFSFDGVNDFINSTSNFFDSSIPHSISLWWKTSDYTKASQTYYSINPFFQEGVLFNHAPNGSPQKITYMLGTGAGTFDINNSLNGFTVTPNFASWHHLIIIRNNTEWKFYSDGVLSHTFASIPTGTLLANIRFGAENNGVVGGGKNFKGQLDDIGIWNRVLTDCEIWKLYNASAGNVSCSSSASMICTGQSVTLTASGATSYTWSPGNFTTTSIVVSPVTTTTYSVAADNTVSTCSSNTTITQMVSPCTGIELSNLKGEELLLFPNPNQGEFFVSYPVNSTVTICDAKGKFVKTFELNESNGRKIKCEGLESGIYFLKLNSEKYTESKRISVIR